MFLQNTRLRWTLIGSLVVHLGFLISLPALIADEPAIDIPIKAVIEVSPIARSSAPKLSDAITPDGSQQQEEPSKGQKFVLPPSAQMSYLGFYNGNQITNGQLSWGWQGQHYELAVFVTVPIFGSYRFQSVGGVDKFGLAPDTYVEEGGSSHRREVIFMRDAKLVQFSKTQQTMTLPEGTQDTFSVIFQLASLAAGDPTIDEFGVARVIPIATVEKVEAWVFVSSGDEQLKDMPVEYQETRRFVRMARDADDRKRFEVWLSKKHHYLPVRIKQTNPNGQTYELRFQVQS